MNNGKYCPEIVEIICKSIEDGNGQIDSANLAGIAAGTYFRWLNEHSEFKDAIKKAQTIGLASVRDKMLKVIDKAASDGTWQAAAWRLERQMPDEFSRKERIDNRHDGEVRIKVANDEISEDDDEEN